MNEKGLLPIADRINAWGREDMRKVIFKCPQCGTVFHYYEEREKYCHECGQKIYWDGITVNQVTDRILIFQCTNNLKKHNETIKKIKDIKLKVKDDSVGD